MTLPPYWVNRSKEVLGHVAGALDGGGGALDLEAQFLHGFAHGVDDAVAGGLGAAQGAAHAHGLAGDEAGVTCRR